MNCSSCGAELDPGTRFCASCGAPVVTSQFCVQCGNEIGANVVFCPGCGANQRTAGPAAGPQYQQPVSYGMPPRGQPRGMVDGEIHYKGIWSRFFAALIDSILFFIFAAIMATRYGTVTADSFNLEGVPALVTYGAYGLYFVIFEGWFKGTIGKLILGIRVVKASGRSPGLGRAIVRNLMRIVDGLFLYLVGVIAVSRSPWKQRVGDRVAGTFVVSRRSAKAMRDASGG
ncbi:MAG: RDD family protein [Dehalococcoidia bacterium]|nr:RDD family protein [Dehalococcoidia bacterium]